MALKQEVKEISFIGLLYVLLKFFPALAGGITAKESALTDLGNVIVVFSFVALAIQSSLEVFVSNWRGQKRTQKQRLVDNLKEDIDELKALIRPSLEASIVLATEQSQTTGTASATPEASASQPSQPTGQRPSLEPTQLTELRQQLAETKEKLETAENDLDLYKDQTKAIVNRLSLLAGITISLAGIRILRPFTNVITLEGQQLALFNVVDILLTGGLLSGGSEGVHRLTKVYENVTDVGKTVGKK